MRTTVDIDEDVLQAVKEIAASRRYTMGRAMSELLRKALTPADHGVVRNGVPLMPRRPVGSRKPTMAEVNRLRDEM